VEEKLMLFFMLPAIIFAGMINVILDREASHPVKPTD
jgi:hypothetical protein